MNSISRTNEYGSDCENKVEGRFKRSGLTFTKLDKRNRGVDYFVFKKELEHAGFLTEVKAIDPSPQNKMQDGLHDYDHIDSHLKTTFREKVEDAIIQYKNTIIDNAQYKNYPFLIFFCVHPNTGFIEQINFQNVTKYVNEFESVSGILTLERDYQRQQINKKQLEKINNLLKVKGGNASDNDWKLLSQSSKGDYEGTQDTIQYKIWINRKAKNRFQPNKYFQSNEYVVEEINLGR